MNLRTLHKNYFLKERERLGIQDYEYPFNTESQGYYSLRDYVNASYGKTGQLLRVSGAAVPFRTVRSTAMLARSATGEVNTVIYLYPAC